MQPLVAVRLSKKGRSLLRYKERHELRAWCVCVGYQAFAFVVDDFDMLSTIFMCPWAGKHSLVFRLLNEILFFDVS